MDLLDEEKPLGHEKAPLEIAWSKWRCGFPI